MAGTDFSDIDSFVQQSQSKGFDDIDSFVAQQSASPEKTSPEVDRAIASVPRPAVSMEYSRLANTPAEDPEIQREIAEGKAAGEAFRKANPAQPYSLRRALIGGATEALTSPTEAPETNVPSLGPEAVQASKELQTPGQRGRGALRAADVALQASSPVIGPAAIESPLSVARGVAEGYVAGKGAKRIAKAAGAQPETQELVESVGQMAPMVGESLLSGTYRALPTEPAARAEGVFRNIVYKAGGNLPENPTFEQANAAYRAAINNLHPDVNPAHAEDARNLNAAWTQLKNSGRFSSAPAAPKAAPAQPALTGEVANAASSMARAQATETAARATVQGVQVPPPPAPAPPEPPAHFAPEDIAKISEQIATLPPDQRADAIIAAHGELSKALLQKGKFIGPDGKLEVVKTPDQADSIAQRIINDEVARIDKSKVSPTTGGGRSAAEMQPAETSPANSVAQSITAARAAARKASAKGQTLVHETTLPDGTVVEMHTQLPPKPFSEDEGEFKVVGEEPAKQPFSKGDKVTLAGVETPAEVKHISDSSGVRVVRLQFDKPTKVPWSDKPVTKTSVPKKYQDSIKAAGEGNIIFARHGETALDMPGQNAKETVAGHSPEPLDERGVKSAEKLAEDLKDKGVTQIVTSDLPRATQTAQIVSDKLGVPVKEDERLRPQDIPETEGMKVSEAKPIWNHYEENPTERPKGGETHEEFAKRQEAAIDEVRESAKEGEKPLVVTHSRNIEEAVGTRPEPGEFVESGAKFKHRSTQVDIPEGSEAHNALEAARQRIADSDLAGKGKDIGGNHITVRWGLKEPDDADLAKLKSYLSSLSPFEAKLGKTESFPPSESSDGAAVIQAPIESPELHKINAELEKHANFTEPTFKEYKPHATIAYVKPDKAGRYTGMSVTQGKPFRVDSIAITDRNGGQEVVKLEGKKPEGGLVIKNMRGETMKRIPTPPFEVRQSERGWQVVDKGGTVWQEATAKADSEAAANRLREKYGSGEENTALVPRKAGDGKHYIHLSGKGAPTLNVRIDSADQASAAMQLYRDKYGLGASEMGEGSGNIFNPEGKQIGYISYNGRVWPGTPQTWKPGTKPLQEAYDFGRGEPKAIEAPERRSNLAERKRVEHMTPEEMRRELLTSRVVDLPNRRAFDEAEHTPAKAVAMSDADGLKAFNDKFGYDAGNTLLRAKAEALKQAGLDAYHEKGDEFLYRGDSEAELQSKLEKARSILRDSVIEVTGSDGVVRRFKGADFSYGQGQNLRAAEDRLHQHKSEREARGERARGELRGITEVAPAAGEEREGNNAQRESHQVEEQSHEQPKPTERNTATEEPSGGELAQVEPQTGQAARKEREAGPGVERAGGAGNDNTPAGEESEPAGRLRAGASESSAVSEGGANAGGQRARKPAVLKNHDWFSHPEDFSVDAGTSKRLEWNLKALSIVKKALAGEIKLSDQDRDDLAHYVGWGALQWAFDPYRSPWGEQKKWIEANRKVEELMTPEEIAAARSSTLNAHYTSPEVVRYVWSALKRAGFDGGAVLEPSMGTGNFFGMMPKAIRSKSQAIGNELDPTTYNIAKLLYPSATLFNKDFVQLMLPDNSLDLVVGNVPFGDEIFDPHYPKLKARIHDYFIVKSLDKLRPGGVAALITSTGTLDKPSSRIREIMANKADLIYALRFPAGTFEKTAGTHVTTDLLVFQKRQPGAPATGEPFLKTVSVEAPHEQDGGMAKDELNEYFDKHPENMLGKLAISRRMYGSNDLVLTPDKSKPFADQLKEALERVPRNVFDEIKSAPLFPAGEAVNLAPDHLVEGSYFLGPKGEIWQKYQGGTRLNPFIGELKPVDKDRMTKLINLRDTVSDLLYTMKTVPNDDLGNREVVKKQHALLDAYKAYRNKHGLVGTPKTEKLFGQDPFYGRLLSLERPNPETKEVTLADIFSKRTVFPPEKLTVLSQDPKDALLQVLNERGKPDLDFMAELSGKDAKELAQELVGKGLVYRDPVSGNYQMADEYLSGYVRDKLADAKKAVEQGQKEYEPNIKALEKVIPADKPIERISVKPGATWIPVEAIQEFVQRFLRGGREVKINYTSGSWSVKDASQSAEIISQYGNEEFPADRLLEMALNLRQPTSYDIVEYVNDEGNKSERRVVNQPRTLAARELQEKLTEEFSRWMKEHHEWAPKLVRLYNDKYNNQVLPKSDGSHLTFPGADLSILRGGQFMPHQRDTIWRVVQHGRGLIAHVVGAGKTYQMIASGMELRRLGLAKKILYAVPNHIVTQWGRDFLKLYPGANVLVIGEDDFSAKNRQAAMAKIATNDWDAIIMPHSHFNMMDISPERQKITLQHDLDELEETIRGLEEQHGAAKANIWGRRAKSSADRQHQRTVKQLESAKKKLETRIAQLSDLKSDKVINFDDTGIDHLYVDEAHEYKNLLFYTKMQRVAGLSQGDAKRATRLKMKTDYLLDRNGNRGVVFATGTPVQNTMAEMYNMIRYVAPDVLEKAGIKYFDDWAANFGKVITALELSADAESYKPRSKFAEFTNVPELQMMFNSFADVKTNDDLPDLKAMLPKLDTGKPIIIEVENPEIEPIVKSLVRRAAALRGEPVPVFDEAGKPVLGEDGRQLMESLPRPKPEEDNMLSVVTEGRLAATDPRLLNPQASGKYGKIYKVAEQVLKEYKDGKAKKVTQLVFIDRFRYTNKATGKEEFNLYHELRKELVKGGIPAKEIAIIHDYDTNDKKLALFDEVNAGKVRVLMGSTQKMGAGTNVQTKLVAEHHVDFPWKPGELEQRDGRIIRQGNTNETVRIYWYATKKSFDAYMGQTLQGKAKFIWQVLAGKNVGDNITDAASDSVLSYEEMKAIASGNPDVKKKMELEMKIRKQEILAEQNEAAVRQREGMISSEHNKVARFEAGKQAMELALKNYQQAVGKDGKGFSLEILGKKYTDRTEALKALDKEPVPISNIHISLQGLPIVIEPSFKSDAQSTLGESAIKSLEYKLPYPTVYYSYKDNEVEGISNSGFDAPEVNLASVVRSAESIIRKLPERIEEIGKAIEFRNQRIARLKELGKEGKKGDDKELRELKRELREVNQRLGIDEFKAAQEQEVATDVDDTPEEESLGERLRGESGEFEPGKIAVAAVKGAAAVGDYIRSEAKANHQARELQAGMYDLEAQHSANVLRAVHVMEEVSKNLGSAAPGMLANVYNHLENAEVPLTPAEEKLMDDTVLPIMENTDEKFKQLQELSGKEAELIEGYVHRVVKNKGGWLDRIVSGRKGGTGRGNLLSKSAPQTKHRSMMAIESPEGDRRVISIKGGEAIMWLHGEPTRLGPIKNAKGRSKVENETFPEGEPNSAFFDKGYVVEGPDGYDWKITQATTKEIEQNTDIEYYHNALASALVSNLQITKALRGAQFIEAFKSSPEFKEIAFPVGKGNPPDGWKTTELPQLRNYYFEPHTAEVLNWYNEKLKAGDPNIFDKLGHFLRTAIFFNPLIHIPNISVHWGVERGGERVYIPTKWKGEYKASVRAINAVLHQNQDFLDALDAGAPLQSHREDTAKITQLFFDQLAPALEKKEPWAEKFAKAIGAAPVDLVKAIYRFSGKATWITNDIAFLQATYAKVERGMSLKDALTETAKHIPDYRLPTRIFNSTAVAKLMSNPSLTMFGAYHYGALKSYGEAMKSALGVAEPSAGRGKAGEVSHGWEILALIGLTTFVLYPLLDKLAQEATGDKNAHLRRAGATTFPYNIAKLAEHEKTPTDVLESVVTPAAHTKAAVEMAANRDLRTGREIYDPHADWETMGQEIGKFLAQSISPIQQASRVASGGPGAGKRFAWGMLGVSFPKSRVEREASRMARERLPGSAVTPEDEQKYALRREILQGLRAGNDKPLEDALHAHRITAEQARQYRHRGHMTPLEDEAEHLTYSQVVKLKKVAQEERDADAEKVLNKVLARKREALFSRGRGAEVRQSAE